MENTCILKAHPYQSHIWYFNLLDKSSTDRVVQRLEFLRVDRVDRYDHVVSGFYNFSVL